MIGNGNAPGKTSTRYLYDGMLLLQERTSAGHPAVTYTRGLDLGSAGASPARAGAFAGSFDGAGGIGGLLARTAHQSTSPYQPSTHAYYHADGGGNVTYLLNRDRTHGASYRYDPYGRLIAGSGPLASANLMRFSSKLWHDHSETYYYGYCFYLTEGERWINRDSIGKRGLATHLGAPPTAPSLRIGDRRSATTPAVKVRHSPRLRSAWQWADTDDKRFVTSRQTSTGELPCPVPSASRPPSPGPETVRGAEIH